MGVGGRRQGGRLEEDMGLPNPMGAIQSRGGEGQEEVGGASTGSSNGGGFLWLRRIGAAPAGRLHCSPARFHAGSCRF
jgi:hypothetical protein